MKRKVAIISMLTFNANFGNPNKIKSYYKMIIDYNSYITEMNEGIFKTSEKRQLFTLTGNSVVNTGIQDNW